MSSSIPTLAAGDGAMTAREVIFWWERRRPLYNLALLAIGVLSITGMEFIMDAILPPGEDAIEPLALLLGVALYGLLANVCYTFGWLLELFWPESTPQTARLRRTTLYRAGMVISCLLTTAPFWLGCAAWLIHRVKW